MSARLAAFNFLLRRVAKPRLRRVQTPAQLRRDFNLAALLLAKPWGTRRTERPGPVPISEFTCGPTDPRFALLYFHGGGYVAGSAFTHRGLAGRLARAAGLRVLLPHYRLAPEDPLPAALRDARRAWEALIAEGFSPSDIALGGDSAGGGLAFALLAELCAAGTPPRAIIGFSPWTDLTGQGASITGNAEADPLFPAERFGDLVGFALGEVPPEDPRLSPLFAAFPAPPPVLIQVGLTEILRDDSLRLAERLRSFGAPVTLETWPDTPHVWQMFGFLPEARQAIASAARFLRAAFRPS